MIPLYDAAKMLPPNPTREYGERFTEAMHAVASGRMTVDQAWSWCREGEDKETTETEGK